MTVDAGAGRGGLRRVAPALAPLLVLAIAGTLLFVSRRAATGGGDDAARNAAHALVGSELHRLRAKWDHEAAGVASAQTPHFVRANLLPGGAAGETITELSVAPLRHSRYRVRGRVAWRGAEGAVVARRFETDLLHGPADDKWRLVDTEFLAGE